MNKSGSQRDLKSLLMLVTISSLVLLGVGLSSVVNISTRDTGLLTQNLVSW